MVKHVRYFYACRNYAREETSIPVDHCSSPVLGKSGEFGVSFGRYIHERENDWERHGSPRLVNKDCTHCPMHGKQRKKRIIGSGMS